MSKRKSAAQKEAEELVRRIREGTLHAVWERLRDEGADPKAMQIVMKMAREMEDEA